MNENNFNDFVFDDTNASSFINDDICERILTLLFFFYFRHRLYIILFRLKSLFSFNLRCRFDS